MPYYPVRDGHPSMFATEDNAEAVSREPILYISGMSGSMDGANDSTAREARMRAMRREAVAPLAAAASAPSAAGRTQLSPERRRALQMLDRAGSRGCREGLLLVLGFEVGILPDLVHDGLGTATCTRSLPSRCGSALLKRPTRLQVSRGPRRNTACPQRNCTLCGDEAAAP
jgi:hypothetical protein